MRANRAVHSGGSLRYDPMQVRTQSGCGNRTAGRQQTRVHRQRPVHPGGSFRHDGLRVRAKRIRQYLQRRHRLHGCLTSALSAMRGWRQRLRALHLRCWPMPSGVLPLTSTRPTAVPSIKSAVLPFRDRRDRPQRVQSLRFARSSRELPQLAPGQPRGELSVGCRPHHLESARGDQQRPAGVPAVDQETVGAGFLERGRP